MQNFNQKPDKFKPDPSENNQDQTSQTSTATTTTPHLSAFNPAFKHLQMTIDHNAYLKSLQEKQQAFDGNDDQGEAKTSHHQEEVKIEDNAIPLADKFLESYQDDDGNSKSGQDDNENLQNQPIDSSKQQTSTNPQNKVQINDGDLETLSAKEQPASPKDQDDLIEGKDSDIPKLHPQNRAMDSQSEFENADKQHQEEKTQNSVLDKDGNDQMRAADHVAMKTDIDNDAGDQQLDDNQPEKSKDLLQQNEEIEEELKNDLDGVLIKAAILLRKQFFQCTDYLSQINKLIADLQEQMRQVIGNENVLNQSIVHNDTLMITLVDNIQIKVNFQRQDFVRLIKTCTDIRNSKTPLLRVSSKMFTDEKGSESLHSLEEQKSEKTLVKGDRSQTSMGNLLDEENTLGPHNKAEKVGSQQQPGTFSDTDQKLQVVKEENFPQISDDNHNQAQYDEHAKHLGTVEDFVILTRAEIQNMDFNLDISQIELIGSSLFKIFAGLYKQVNNFLSGAEIEQDPTDLQVAEIINKQQEEEKTLAVFKLSKNQGKAHSDDDKKNANAFFNDIFKEQVNSDKVQKSGIQSKKSVQKQIGVFQAQDNYTDKMLAQKLKTTTTKRLDPSTKLLRF
eukprot:403356711